MIRFTTNQRDLQNALAIATRAVSQRTTMPILECVLLEASQGRITVTGNDMQKGIETSTVADIEEGGTIAVNAKMFFEIVKRLSNSTISFTADENNIITIKSGKSKFQLAGQSGDEFPRLDDIKSDGEFVVTESVLRDMINRTIFATSTNESNQIMTGELFDVVGDSLRVVAIDGHRIAIRKEILDRDYGTMSVIIPKETLSEISRILSDDAGSDVSIRYSMNHVMFQFGDVRAVSRLIDGKYYDIDKLLSNQCSTKISVRNAEMQKSMERSLLFIKEGAKTPIIVNITDGEMNLSINTQTGSFNESIEIQKEGQDLEIGFNPKFVSDALVAAGDEVVTIYLSNGKAPCFIKDEDESYNYAVLPVNYQK